MNADIDKIKSTIFKYLERFDSNKIEQLEKHLNVDSIISLTYLLFDNRKEALNCLTDKCDSEIITEWCRKFDRKNNGEWKLRIVESLLLMQNFKYLKHLGYNKRDLNEVKHFLNMAQRSAKFDKRKIFYSIFDSLTVDELDKVIQFIDKNENFCQSRELFKSEFIEIYLLRWEEDRKIRLHLNGLISLKLIFQELNLNFGLKAIDEYINYWPDEDDAILDNVQGTDVKDIDERMSDSAALSLPSQLSCNEVDDVYKIINPDRVGICIIVNQENYDKSSKHKPRHGSKYDIDKLGDTMGIMNIKSYKLTDLKHNEIFPSIEAKVKECFDPNIHSVLFVVIMAHGQKGSIFGTDGIAVDTDTIRDSLSDDKCPVLKDKPKIIIFQCCRGDYHYGSNNLVADGPEEMVEQKSKTSMEDYIICWSTLPGFKSYRSRIDGSLYIQALCECLELSYTKDHVPKILTRVQKVFNEQKQIYYNKEIGMVPEFYCGLTRELYLVQQ